jgi:hypothetical protein
MVHAHPNLSLLTSIDYFPPVKVRVAELGARKLFLNVLHVIDYGLVISDHLCMTNVSHD